MDFHNRHIGLEDRNADGRVNTGDDDPSALYRNLVLSFGLVLPVTPTLDCVNFATNRQKCKNAEWQQTQ